MSANSNAPANRGRNRRAATKSYRACGSPAGKIVYFGCSVAELPASGKNIACRRTSRLRHDHGRKCRSGSPFLTDFLMIPIRSPFKVDSVLEVC